MNNLLKRNLLYKNKEQDNYLQELDNRKLTLRKEKLSNNLMKRRFENIENQFGYFLEHNSEQLAPVYDILSHNVILSAHIPSISQIPGQLKQSSSQFDSLLFPENIQ